MEKREHSEALGCRVYCSCSTEPLAPNLGQLAKKDGYEQIDEAEACDKNYKRLQEVHFWWVADYLCVKIYTCVYELIRISQIH